MNRLDTILYYTLGTFVCACILAVLLVGLAIALDHVL